MAAGFEDVVEAYHVRLDVGIRILDTVADTRLRGEVDNNVRLILLEEGVNSGFVGDVAFDKEPRPPLIPLFRGKFRSPPYTGRI